MSARDARPHLEIDLAALRWNYRRLCAEAAGAEVAGVVKANGYGLGTTRVARTLGAEGCRTFYVARAEEALALRADLGPTPRILVLEGVPFAADDLAAAGVVPVLNAPDDLDTWMGAADRAGRRLEAVVHVDTGMTRLGFKPNDLVVFDAEALQAVRPLYLMSHLAAAEDDAALSEAQRARLLAAALRLPGVPLSLANSAGTFKGAPYTLALCRPGIALYGGNPTPGRANPMRPVVRLTAPILQVHKLDVPATVGYGATYAAPAGAVIATLGLGYADGYPRAAGNRAIARVAGREVPVVGRVSMDLIGLDVTGVEGVGPGIRAEAIFGPDGVDRLALAAETIAYEVLTRIGPRVERVYVEGKSA